MLKITILTCELGGVTRYTGGVGPRYRVLATELAARGHDVTVVLQSNDAPVELPSLAFNLLRIPAPMNLRVHFLRPLVVAIRFRRAVREFPPADIVLAPEWGGWAAMLRLSSRTKLVTNLVTSLRQVRAIEPAPASSLSDRASDLVQRALERLQAKRSASLIAISGSIRDWSVRMWKLQTRSIEVIPNFINVDEIQASYQHQISKGILTRPRIVFVGRVSGWKGADVLGNAMKSVWREFPSAQVQFIGRVDSLGSRNADDVLREVAGDFSDRLSFLGPTARDELLRQLVSSDIAVFPSRYEGFGIAALEAMAVGLPVIVTSGSGFEDFCLDGENAMMVEPGSEKDLERALRDLIVDAELRARLSRNGRLSSRGFDGAAIVERYERHLSQTAGVSMDTSL